MEEQFKEVRLHAPAMRMVEQANEIIEQYQTDDIQLTLRQLYYQFVARDLLENNQKNYTKLGHVLSEARLGGLVDWSAIDDLGRVPSIPGFYESKEDFVESLKRSARGYTLNRWETQPAYCELWVEKQALSSVLAPIADKWDVPFTMNRGYSSQTAMYDASKRFYEKGEFHQCVLIYVGDHDPSGEDMVRDIDDRLRLFRCDVEVRKIALTMAQVKKYKCPKNPAKFKDPRAKDYIAKFGRSSWEVDALDPKVLRQLAENEIESLIDVKAWNKIVNQIERERTEINIALEAIA